MKSFRNKLEIKTPFFLVLVFLVLSSCSNSNPISTFLEQHSASTVKQIQTDEFTLLFAIPDNVKVGDDVDLHSKLVYTGDGKISLEHGDPPIIYRLLDPSGDDVIRDFHFLNLVESSMRQNDYVETSITTSFAEQGKYILSVRTTTLSVDGERVKGAGNEPFITDNMSSQEREGENSKLSILEEIHVDH